MVLFTDAMLNDEFKKVTAKVVALSKKEEPSALTHLCIFSFKNYLRLSSDTPDYLRGSKSKGLKLMIKYISLPM